MASIQWTVLSPAGLPVITKWCMSETEKRYHHSAGIETTVKQHSSELEKDNTKTIQEDLLEHQNVRW